MQALLDAGADVEAKNDDGWTPLHAAAWHDNSEALVALLEAGADVNARNNADSTPLSLAKVMGNESAIWELEKAGACELTYRILTGLWG